MYKNALNCFARLVRLLLGETAIANQKLELGADPNLQVLTVTGSSPIFKGDTAPISGTEEYMYIIYDYFS